MKGFKRILSIALVFMMTLALVPVVSPAEVSAAATGTTSLFNGNATYLLQERFNGYFQLEANGGGSNSVLSGWDVDYRGGRVLSTNGVATLTDTNGFEKTDMSHYLMKHTGDGLVMESSFRYAPTTNTPMDGGFHYTLSGEGKTAVKIEVLGDKNGFFFYVNGTNTNVACVADTTYHVKAELTTSSKTANVWINGAVAATGASYVEAATCIDDITVGTTDEMHSIVNLYNVFVYVNYTVNETFIGAPLGTTPAWWTTSDVVAKAPGSPYPADVNGLSLSAGGVKPNVGSGAANPVSINYPLDSSSELTWVQSAVTVSDADGVGGRDNVVKATGVANSNTATVGVKLGGSNFAFQEGDVITYSVDYYTAANASPQMWLRRHTGTLEPFRSKSFSVTGGTWTTLTETIPFESLGGTANQNTWTDAGQYALYVRGGASEIYLDNFKVTVTREVDNTVTASSGVLHRSFDALSGKQSFVWNMLVPSAGANGFAGYFGGAEFTVSGGKFYLNGQDAGSYRNNTWYKIEVQTNGSTADVFVNDVKKVSGVSASGTMDYIMLVNGSSNAVIVDDIQVYKTFATSDYANYPSPDSVVATDGWHLGMVVYPMWYEGTHYGWDAITPYEDRTPYQGYYTGGSKEVSDWDAKWMLEHGIDHAIYPFVNPKAGEQAKMSVRGEALAGYKAGEYTNSLSFATMITNPLDENLDSSADYIANAVPYIVEHNFKNPAYKKIDGRLPVYMYNPDEFASLLGGDSELNAVLEALNTEAINLGHSGILFLADISSSSSAYINTFKTNCNPSYPVYKWRYSWSSDVANGIIKGIDCDYDNYSDVVASVPMGFDNTPWRSNDIDIMTPEQVKSIVASIPTNIGSDDPHIVLFTCWDEWGEGHFYAPSAKGGFGYLNAIREVVAGSAKTDEDMPSSDSVKRMGVLHPEGRQILKIRDDRRIYTTDDLAGFTQLGTVNLQNVSSSHNDTRTSIFGSWTCPGWTYGTMGGCTMTATASNTSEGSGTFATSRSHSGTLSNIVYEVSNPNQATVNWDISNLGLDLSKVSAIKVNGYAENSALMVINFATSETDDTDYSGNLRFCAASDGDTTAKDYILLPDVSGGPAGTASRVRFNPAQNTSVGSKFQINSITFYQGEFEEVKVYIDDKETHLVSEAVVEGGETFIPAYQVLLNAGAYVEWDKDTKKLTVEKDGITAVFQDGSNYAAIEGADEDIELSAEAYYKEGNLFVPYDGLLAPFGYTVSVTGDDIYYYNKFWSSSYDDSDFKWDFEIDGNNDSWTSSGGVKVTTKHGLLHVRSTSTDPTINRKNLSLSTDDYKYLVMKVKKSDVAAKGMMRLYSGTSLPSAGGVVYNYTIEPSDEVQTLVFDLANDYDTSSGRSTFADLGGTVTNLRMDPMDTGNTFGSFYIDSIEFTNEDPTYVEPAEPTMVAYGFEDENMFDLSISKIGTQYTNLLNAEGSTASDKLPPVETVDGYENVMKLIPSAGNNSGMFHLTSVWYNGARSVIKSVAEGDEIVKVSFWYKAVANGTGFRFENRQGSSRDGEEFTKKDASTTEWKYFEEYLDMSKVADASRWFTLRIYRNGTTVNDGGLYVRDYKFVCLDQTSPITTYDDTIAVMVDPYDETTNIGKMYISEHNTADEVLRKISVDKYPIVKAVTRNDVTANETQKYFFYKPKAEDSDTIKCFLWDNTQYPVCEIFSLQRAN